MKKGAPKKRKRIKNLGKGLWFLLVLACAYYRQSTSNKKMHKRLQAVAKRFAQTLDEADELARACGLFEQVVEIYQDNASGVLPDPTIELKKAIQSWGLSEEKWLKDLDVSNITKSPMRGSWGPRTWAEKKMGEVLNLRQRRFHDLVRDHADHRAKNRRPPFGFDVHVEPEALQKFVEGLLEEHSHFLAPPRRARKIVVRRSVLRPRAKRS